MKEGYSRNLEAIKKYLNSKFFEEDYYLEVNPDVRSAGVDPREHFKIFGWNECRDSSRAFDILTYACLNPEIFETGTNPYEHFVDAGLKKSVGESGPDNWLPTYKDLRAAAQLSIIKFADHGVITQYIYDNLKLFKFLAKDMRDGVEPNSEFDSDFYRDYYLNPRMDVPPLLHYLRVGNLQGNLTRSPAHQLIELELYSAEFYLDKYRDVAAAGVDPTDHFLKHGWKEHRQASRFFDPVAYLSLHSGAIDADENAYVHFVRHACDPALLSGLDHPVLPNMTDYEALLATALFDPEFHFDQRSFQNKSYITPALLYLCRDARIGLAPSSEFDPEIYSLLNSDIRHAEIQPLLHYLRYGRQEGRPYKPPFGADAAELEAACSLLLSSGEFDFDYYYLRNPKISDSPLEAVRHYLLSGHLCFQSPSPEFDAPQYYLTHEDCHSFKIPAFLHKVRRQASIGQEFERSKELKERLICVPYCADARNLGVECERLKGIAFLSGFGYDKGYSNPDIEAGIEYLCSLKTKLCLNKHNPVVTIIVPVHGQIEFVLNCLESVAQQNTKYSCEILVVDDASPSGTGATALERIGWIKYQRIEQNVGFIGACNFGASVSSGSMIVFLNSDVRVADCWLENIVSSFDLFPRAGIIGSKLYNPDGTLQEAGGVIYHDGRGANYGRGDAPEHPRYSYARQVDYCSGAAIAIRKEHFVSAGQFSELYKPAYCEDLDLSFALREQGLETWLQPLARVIHYEGKSHGTDIENGVKSYQRANLSKFAARWKNVLSRYKFETPGRHREANRYSLPRMLVIDALTPTPDKDSGSFITDQMIRSYQTLGYDVSFVPQHNYAHSGDYTGRLQKSGVHCFYWPFVKNIEDVLAEGNNFNAVLVYRYGVMMEVVKQVREVCPTCVLLFHTVDLHYIRERRAGVLQNDPKKIFQSEVTQTNEISMVMAADMTIVHTPAEKSELQSQLPVENILEFPYVAEVKRTQAEFDARRDILFLGGFAHTPNVDAVVFFASEVWSRLKRLLPPDANFVIVGADPSPEIYAVGEKRVLVKGFEPDLSRCFDAARVFVAPLRYGAGIKGKVVQSLCHGVPAVCTTVAAEGMGLVDRQEVLISDEVEDIIFSILKVYYEKKFWHEVQRRGYEFVERNYSWKNCIDTCSRVVTMAYHNRMIWEKRRRGIILENFKRDGSFTGPSFRHQNYD